MFWTHRASMNGVQICLVALALQTSLLNVNGAKHNRRSMASQAALPVSKGGWRPVIGSNGLLYSALGTAPLHPAPSYKIPVPVLDMYPSSSRPLTTRDASKLTSIAQSYRPTTHRTISAPAQSHAMPVNQPINSYHNPFLQNPTIQNLPNGFAHYKFVQNYPADSVLIRNAHNPYAARPVLQKYSAKQKPFGVNVYQPISNLQAMQFGPYQSPKPLDLFAKPVEGYARPDSQKKPQSADTEIFKPEVYKLPDSDTAPQSLNQQVKTAQQQTYAGVQQQQQTYAGVPPQQQTYAGVPAQQQTYPGVAPKLHLNPFAQYSYQDLLANFQQFPPSILGSFGSLGVPPAKGKDPLTYSTTKTVFPSQQSTKQTIFNSYGYTPNFKTTPTFNFGTTTPKFQITPSQFVFGSTLNDFRPAPTPQTKPSTQSQIEPNDENQEYFKPSPQDPFVKGFHNLDFNKITTYNPPIVQTTTLANNLYNDYNFVSQQNPSLYNYDNQNDNNYDKKQIHDSIGLNQQVSQQYVDPQSGALQYESVSNSAPTRPTYEVTENESDIITHSSPAAWTVIPESLELSSQPSTEAIGKPDTDTSLPRPTTPIPDLPEEYAIVTEGEKGYENSLTYDNNVDTQSRRPLGDDFEPIGKHKLKDYYYKVSTPLYNEQSSQRRTKRPTEAPKIYEVTTHKSVNNDSNDIPVDALPTLPPNKHFKRPSTSDPIDKDKIRKRTKLRRRRPPLASNNNRTREESTAKRYTQSSTEGTPTTEAEETHTIKPRVRPGKQKNESNLTTPSITTDLTTSALPTITPTVPTIVKKKHGQRRQTTTPADRIESTTQSAKDNEPNKESPIMKISSRPQFPKLSSFNFQTNETPDYSHKQDEKDTPTSDVSVSLTDTLKTTSDTLKDFSFHRDVRPVEIKETTTELFKDDNEASTTRADSPSRNNGKVQRPRLKNKFDRPRFSVKDYRNRLSSTTSTTEKSSDPQTKVRFPQRKIPYAENYNIEVETTTERKKFMPKDPRFKINRTDEQVEIVQTTRQTGRQRQTTVEPNDGITQKMSSRIRNGQRRPRPTEETTETTSPTTVHSKRPLRKKIKDSEIGESVQDVSVTETTSDHKIDATSERTKSESAIMKIADKKHHDHVEHLFEHSKRVSDLTLAASKDYNTPGMFKTVSSNSRRIPNYFTIATDDPILPIEAFFPQLNQKKES